MLTAWFSNRTASTHTQTLDRCVCACVCGHVLAQRRKEIKHEERRNEANFGANKLFHISQRANILAQADNSYAAWPTEEGGTTLASSSSSSSSSLFFFHMHIYFPFAYQRLTKKRRRKRWETSTRNKAKQVLPHMRNCQTHYPTH